MKKINYVVILLALVFGCFERVKADTNGGNSKIEYVDIGLSVMWASCNEGATTPEGFGNYYTWNDARKFNLPTVRQLIELLESCTWEKTFQNGVEGFKVTGTNENSIFLPAAACETIISCYKAGTMKLGFSGYYWTNSASPYPASSGYSLNFFATGYKGLGYDNNNNDKYPIRTVAEKDVY